jgi:GTPase
MSMSYRSGTVALIGRPNVGKSTLLNRLMGRKISITSRRPQTTQHRIYGIKTGHDAQIVYVDTPGTHPRGVKGINRYMQRVTGDSITGVDSLLLIIAGTGWRADDEHALALARAQSGPVILVINMIDKLGDHAKLLPLLEKAAKKMEFTELVPVSAKTGENLSDLEHTIIKYLPEQPPLYPLDQVTNLSDRFQVSELIRERIYRGFGQEIPYATRVEIEKFKRHQNLMDIGVVIWVEKEGQKAILIGKGGVRLKRIGQSARQAIQKLYGVKVHLKLWVKVRANWTIDQRVLRDMGYIED